MEKEKRIVVELPFKLEESNWNAETVARMEKEYVRELACHLALINANSNDMEFCDTAVTAIFGITAFMVNCEFLKQEDADEYLNEFLANVNKIV